MQRLRSRSRSPLNRGLSVDGDNKNSFTLFVGNLPKHWNYRKVKNFVLDTCQSEAISQTLKYVNLIKDKFGKSVGECLLIFTSHNACLMTLHLLRGAVCEDKKIVVMQDSGESFQRLEKSGSRKQDTLSDIPPLMQQKINIQTSQTEDKLEAQRTNETYGLSMSFLESLDIKLPLTSRIFVANLPKEMNEAKLRELFGLAGQVVDVVMLKKTDTKVMATIEFDHPVEAVQAISMFDGHEYMDRKLIVKKDRKQNAYNRSLPANLKTIGPGLGPNGEPLRGVRNVVEFEPLKQLLLQELAKIQSMKLQDMGERESAKPNDTVTANSVDIMTKLMALQNPMGLSLNVNPFNQLNQQAWGQNLLNSQPQNLQMMQGLLQPNVVSDLTGFQAQNVPNFNQNMNMVNMAQNQTTNIPQNQMSNVSQTQWGNTSQNQLGMVQSNTGSVSQYTDYQDSITQKMQIVEKERDKRSTELDDPYVKYNEFDIERLSTFKSKYKDTHRRSESPKANADRHMTSDMLVFSNLPSSVTPKALSSKMSEVGEVKFAELTGHSRAIVRFAKIRDAERCIKLFHHSKVDGQTIKVSFF